MARFHRTAMGRRPYTAQEEADRDAQEAADAIARLPANVKARRAAKAVEEVEELTEGDRIADRWMLRVTMAILMKAFDGTNHSRDTIGDIFMEVVNDPTIFDRVDSVMIPRFKQLIEREIKK